MKTYGQNSITFPFHTTHLDPIITPLLYPLDRPITQHDPCQQRVEQEDQRETDSSRNGRVAVAGFR